MNDALHRRVETLEKEPRRLRVDELPRDACLLLLGDPGTGKTTVLKAASSQAGGGFVTVRAFLARPTGRAAPGAHLFLDALDEALAARASAPLDAVVARLHEVGAPSFWLSCRPVDWAAVAGRALLEDCAGDRGLLVVRLLPLEAEVIREIVRGRKLEPRDFLRAVEEAGLSALLGNPQTLGLLLDVAGRREGLPTSRRGLHEAATDLLAREANGDRPRPPPGERLPPSVILRAAGAACAAMLLSDRPTITLDADVADDDGRVPFDVLAPSPDDVQSLHAALGTRLFAAADEDRWVPQHRTVAEFLAARFLAERIAPADGPTGRGGFPLARAVALICGGGDEPHPALRGLFAWLVTLLPDRAETLVGRDPYGVLAYGDTSGFPSAAAAALLRGLEELQERDPYFRAGLWGEARFAALASPGLVPEIRRILAARPPRGHLLSCVLDGLAEGEPRPELVPELVAHVTDAGLGERDRSEAIPALVRACTADAAPALALFARLLAEPDLDPRRRLLTRLFLRLYPGQLGVADLGAFTSAYVGTVGEDRSSDGIFLEHRLPELVPPCDEPAVLDVWAAQPWVEAETRPLSRAEAIGKVARRLLRQALPVITPEDGDRLVGWLRVAEHDTNTGDDRRQVTAALAARPDLFVPMAIGATERAKPPHLRRAFNGSYNLGELLPGDGWPADAGTRLLDAALAESDPFRAELLFRMAGGIAFGKDGAELFERVHAAAAREARFAAAFDPMCCWTIPSDEHYWQRKNRIKARERAEKNAEVRANTRAELRAALPGMADGSAVNELAWLANLMFGRRWPLWAKDLLPAERIAAAADPDVVEAARAGCARLAVEDTLPSAEEVADHLAEGILPPLTYAWLGGADLLFARAEPGLPHLPPDRLMRLLTLGMATSTYSDGDRKPDARPWIGRVVTAAPDAAREAIRAFLLGQFRAGRISPKGLDTVLQDPAFLGMRRALLPDLLEEASPSTFDAVAEAVLREFAGATVLDIVRRILARTETAPAADRWRWLALGWRLSPEEMEDAVEAAVREEATLLERLPDASGESLWGRHPTSGPPLRLRHRALLVRLCGPAWPPAPLPDGVHTVPSAYEFGSFVHAQLERTALDPNPAATAILEAFRDDPAIARYRDAVAHLQAVRRREMARQAWETPSPERVVAALRAGPPASGPDLMSFVEDHLRTVDLDLRRTGENAWAGFWNTDAYGRAKEAKVENRCRDHLSTLLRARLEAAGVSSATEVRDAGDDRCDIVLYGGERTLPVEVKREWHPELWTAWRDQLGDRYAANPSAGGFGIYLVFWFGREREAGARRPPAPDGRPVAGPGELERRLQDIVDAAGYRLRVVVMNVTPVTRAG